MPYHGCAPCRHWPGAKCLEFEAEPDCCCPRFVIERIALPSVAAVAKFIKGALHHQVHRLGRGNSTLKWRRVNDPANLDATSGRVNIQIARLAERTLFRARRIVRTDRCRPGQRRKPGICTNRSRERQARPREDPRGHSASTAALSPPDRKT